jgi:Fe2+ transport system protein B
MPSTKKIILPFAVIAVILMIMMVAVAQAAPNIGFDSGGMASNIAGQAGYDTSQTETSLSQTVGGIIRGVLSVIGVLFLVLTIYAGFLWMTASGSEDKVSKAKNILT